MKLYLTILFGLLLTSCKNSTSKVKSVNTDTIQAPIKKEPLWPEVLPDDGQVGVRKGAVFIFKNRGFELFSGGASMGKQYAQVINSFNRLKIPGLKIYNLIIPNGFEFEVTEKYKDRIKPAKQSINELYSHLDPDIIKVNPVDTIRKHRTEYIYFNTDHHWTSLGAYYAYRSFCAAAAHVPVELDSIPSKVKPGFLGLFYRVTKSNILKSNPDSVRYYLFPDSINFYIGASSIGYWAPSRMYAEQVTGANSYSVFLQGDLPICKMETQKKNGRKIAIVKESYGNAFAPFLINNYEKIIVVDQRSYKGNFVAMLKAEGINELLFLNNIFAAHTQFHIDHIRKLLPPTP
jgi:hypothetical protein